MLLQLRYAKRLNIEKVGRELRPICVKSPEIPASRTRPTKLTTWRDYSRFISFIVIRSTVNETSGNFYLVCVLVSVSN